MHVYEYQCDDCGERFELFLRSVARQASAMCPKCGSPKGRKAISLFGIGGSGGGTRARDASCGPGRG